jgi:hypothetical protein
MIAEPAGFHAQQTVERVGGVARRATGHGDRHGGSL